MSIISTPLFGSTRATAVFKAISLGVTDRVASVKSVILTFRYGGCPSGGRDPKGVRRAGDAGRPEKITYSK
ncbi:MAG TPA: hypothetical protein VL157_02180 [Gemmatimonadaceae bacterium]|nr:hypothetical protein [Gemmatimonadaceae bacterium]